MRNPQVICQRLGNLGYNKLFKTNVINPSRFSFRSLLFPRHFHIVVVYFTRI